jgi:hypothetical protein
MPKFVFDIKVDGKTWVRTAEVGSYKGAEMLCSYTERLFELIGVPAKATVAPIQPVEED